MKLEGIKKEEKKIEGNKLQVTNEEKRSAKIAR